MRQAHNNRVDENQAQIVKELRQAGCTVQSLGAVGDGCPDLLVGCLAYRNHLFEVKNPNKPPSKRRLTTEQVQWHNTWKGQVDVIETAEDALKLMGLFEWTPQKA